MKTISHWLTIAGLWPAVCLPCAAQNPAAAVLQPPIIDGANAIIKWNSGGALQLASTITGPWMTVTGGVMVMSMFTEPVARGARFFRVVENGIPGQPIPIFPATPKEPLPVERATIRKLPLATNDGNAELEMTLAPDATNVPSSFPLLLEDRLVTFRQTGARTFSGIILVDTTELELINTRVAELSPQDRVQPKFVGRQIDGTNLIDFFDITNYNAGRAVQVHPFPFGAADFSTNRRSPGQVVAAGAPPPLLNPAKTLMITDLSVVKDPTRTWDPATPTLGTPMGAWTFGKLITDMANTSVTGISPSEFVRRWLRSWELAQTVNFDGVPSRPSIQSLLIEPWEIASGGLGSPLNLAKAPFRLLAIVNRVDLRDNSAFGDSNAGEARFVFGAIGPGSVVLPFTVIFEYGVPTHGCGTIRNWGRQWADLDRLAFGAAFNTALQAITDQFATVNSDPSKLPNKSALNQLRSNEIAMDIPWELREWRIAATDADAGHLRMVTVRQTPAASLNNSALIATYCNTPANIPLILADNHVVPLTFQSAPFLGGAAPTLSGSFFWNGPAGSIPTPNLRHKFSINTCSGCHSGETLAPFTHVTFRSLNSEAGLSGFLTGGLPVADPAAGTPARSFNDLARRAQDLDRLVNLPCFFGVFHLPFKTPH